MLRELPDQIRSRAARGGNGRPDHLARRRARRIQPELFSIRHDAVALRVGEPHGEVAWPLLVELAARRVGIAEHGVVDDLGEVGLESADCVEGCGCAVEDRAGILRNDGMME